MTLYHLRDSARKDWLRHDDDTYWPDVTVFVLALGSLLAWLAGWLP